MKLSSKLFSAIIAIGILFSCGTVKPNLTMDSFYENYSQKNAASNIKIPAFLLNSFISNNSSLKPFADKINSVRVFSMSELNNSSLKNIKTDLGSALRNEKYSDYISNGGENTFKIAAKENGDILDKVMIATENNGTFLLMELDSSLTQNDMKNLVEMIKTKKIDVNEVKGQL